MAASVNDYLDQVSSSTSGRPVVATLQSPGKALAASSITISAATNWTTTTGIHFSIYKTTAAGIKDGSTQTDWKGTLSGTTISNLTITGGTDQAYAAGDIVELTPTSRWAKDVYQWGIAEHNQDGSHAAITATSANVSGSITNKGAALHTIRATHTFDFVASGCVWSGDAYASTRNASMTAGVVVIGGVYVSVSAVTARSFTASRDTYIDVDNTGTITYTEVTNNNASPALAANSIRLGIIVTGASNIAAAGSVNQGEESKVLPIVSSVPYAVTDSLGNLICPRDPNRRILGTRLITSSFTLPSSTIAQVTGLSVPVIIPTGRKVKITVFANSVAASVSPSDAFVTLWDGTVSSGTQLALSHSVSSTSNYEYPHTISVVVTPTSTSKTYNVGLASNTGVASIANSSVRPSYIIVELV